MKRILTILALAAAMLVPTTDFTAQAKKAKSHRKTARKTVIKEEILETVEPNYIQVVPESEVKGSNEIRQVEEIKQEGWSGDCDVMDDQCIKCVKVVEYTPEPVLKKEERTKTPISDDTIFKAVEQMAQFPGGQAALMSWLAKNIHYPQTALMNDIQGKVIVEFIVEKDGSVSNARVVKGVDKDLDREAIRVVKSMPRWQPGKNKGEPVRCYYVLPVTFKIQQQDTDTEGQ